MMEGMIRAVGVAIVIVILSEMAKRSTFLAAIAASFPFATIATVYLLRMENQPEDEIRYFITKTALFLPPSLVFFIGLPYAMKKGMSFHIAMPIFVALTFMTYALYIMILKKFGFDLSQ